MQNPTAKDPAPLLAMRTVDTKKTVPRIISMIAGSDVYQDETHRKTSGF